MSLIQVTFQLTGANAGRTMTLRNKYNFVNGQTTLRTTPEQMALHAKALETNWAVLPVGDPRLNPQETAHEQRDLSSGAQLNGDEDVQGDGEPSGSGAEAGGTLEAGQDAAAADAGTATVPAGGDGHPPGLIAEPKAFINTKLVKALGQLDPKADDHWTKDGKPAMTAVETFYGASDITRADVSAAVPGLTRATAPAQE